MSDSRIFDFVVRTPASFTDKEWEHLASLTRQSFKERVEAGLQMMPNHITAYGLKKRSDECLYFCAQDRAAQNFVAYLMIGYHKNSKGISYGNIKIAACSPDIKRQGLTSRLYAMCENQAIEFGCHYITSDTGTRVKSSVRWHKKMGFSIKGYTHYAHTNYYSILFIKHLKMRENRLKLLWNRLRSWCKIHIRYTEEGQLTSCAKVLELHSLKTKGVKGEELNLVQVQQLTYNVLTEFVDFCEKHQLRYLVCYGSLIGAVRHHGFIPWDDDIDVTMPLPDYRRFLELYNHDKQHGHFEVLTGTKRNVSIPFAMLVDNRTRTLIPGRDAVHSRPLAMDIFPAYPVGDTLEEVHRQIADIWDGTRGVYRAHELITKNPLKTLYRFLFANSDEVSSLKKIERVLRRYPWGGTKYVRIFSLEEKEPLLLPADCFDNYLTCEFEQTKVRIPRQYHEHLTECYGDYMQLPPEDRRVACIEKCYWISDEPAPEVFIGSRAEVK